MTGTDDSVGRMLSLLVPDAILWVNTGASGMDSERRVVFIGWDLTTFTSVASGEISWLDIPGIYEEAS